MNSGSNRQRKAHSQSAVQNGTAGAWHSTKAAIAAYSLVFSSLRKDGKTVQVEYKVLEQYFFSLKNNGKGEKKLVFEDLVNPD